MISRVADSCFWLSRYLERVDTWSRLLGVASTFALDVSLPSAERWRSLTVVVGQEEDFLERVGATSAEDAEAVQQYLVWDAEQPCSIYSSFRFARENARTVREVISVEMWEALNDAWLWLQGRSAKRLYERDRDSFYDQLIAQVMTFHGLCYSTMLHEEPFVFMKLGRAVERISQTARVLDVEHHALGDTRAQDATTSAQWLMILRSLGASEPFFQQSRATPLNGTEVARFLIFGETFPRSVMHNLGRTRGLMARLREDDPRDLERRSWRQLESFRGTLYQMEMEDVQRMGLHEALTWIVSETAELCEALQVDYLDPPQQMIRWQSTPRSRARASQSAQSQSQG